MHALKIAIVLLAACAVFAQQEIKSGRYQFLSLQDKKIAYFKLNVPSARQAPLDIQINPMTCSGPVSIYASFLTETPTSATATFKIQGRTSSITQLVIPKEQVSPTKNAVFIGVEFSNVLGSLPCSAWLVALLNHYQSMTHVIPGVAALGNFTSTQEVHHFYEFFVNETASKQKGHIGILVTGLEKQLYDAELNIFASTKTSRPLPDTAQWSGLMTQSGAFLSIMHTDPMYQKEAHYWFGINSNGPVRPELYSVMVFHLNGDNERPMLLNANQPQVGYSFTGDYTYYYAYSDAAATQLNIRLIHQTGTATMYVSTTNPRPSDTDYEYKSDDSVTVFGLSQKFVYIAVMPNAGSPGLAAYVVSVTRT